MSDSASRFYPPRARWHSPLKALWFKIYRGCGLEHFVLPMSGKSILLSILLPGFVFRVYGFVPLSNALMAAYAMALLNLFIWLGYFLASACFAFLLSLHVISILFLLRRLGPNLDLSFRLFAGAILALGLTVFVYLRAQTLLSRAIYPLETLQQVWVVNVLSPPDSVRRQDWIACKVNEEIGHGYILKAGFGVTRVLGTPGDSIVFSQTNLTINGTVHPREATMPTEGHWRVPENNWFIWPPFAIEQRGNGDGQMAAGFRRNAFVPQAQFLGKPFQRWFFRRQLP